MEWEREVYIAQHLRRRISWQDRLEVLEGVLAIGRQAEVLATNEVKCRLDAVQQSAKAPTSVADHLKFSKIKEWLAPAL